MVARFLKKAALGGAVTLAVAAALAIFWGIGSGRPVLAGNLAGAPAHYRDGLPRPQMTRADTGAHEQAGSSIFLPLVSRHMNTARIEASTSRRRFECDCW